ncbi:MAG: sensor domain-containing protein [Panacagrimonas sp.]
MLKFKAEPRNLTIVAGLVAAVVLAGFGARTLMRASDLQDEYNHGRAVQVASSELVPLLGSGDSDGLRRMVEDLVSRDGLGISFLSVRDTGDRILAVDGRYERLNLPFVSGATRLALRTWLYRWTSQYHRRDLDLDGVSVGRAEYAFAPGLAANIREQALHDLRLAGWIGVLLALPIAVALLMVMYRGGQAPQQPRRPIEDLDPDEPEKKSPVESAGMLRNLTNAAGHTLDGLGRAVLTVNREARIVYINRSAAELTGWSVEEARGRLVYSVFHPLDEQHAPLVTPAENCLRENREYTSTEMLLRSRTGAISHIEVLAVPLHEDSEPSPSGAAMMFHDVGERHERIEELRRSVRLSLGVIDHLVEGVLTTDPAGVVRFANARALRMFGYGRDELDGVTITKLMPVPFLNTPGLHLTDYIGGRQHSRLPKVVGWRKDATTFPVELVVQPMNVDDSEGLVVIMRDITDRLRSDNLAQRLGRLLDAAAEEVYIFDAQSLYFVEVNSGARRNLGYAANELGRLTPLAISQQLETDTYFSYLARLRGGEVDHLTYRTRHVRADGSDYPVEVRLNFSREEEPPVYMAIAVDISDREAQEEKLRHLAQHDPLTGLPNRATLLDRLQQALLIASRSNRLVGVFFVDLDRFKQINDQHGHDVGDQVLIQAAQRLSGVLRETDTVARMGGDEFVVVAQGLRGLDDAETLARKVLEVFSPRFEIPGHDVRMTPSVGVALFPLDESDAEGLLRHADAAMYQAKQAGPGQFRVYSVEVPPQKRRRLELERNLHAAFALQQFELEATPAFQMVRGGSTPRVGALLLDFWWRHPRQGRISGKETMIAAGRAGLPGELELWLLHAACSMLPVGETGKLDAPPLPVILDQTGWQLKDPDFSIQLFELMERYQIPPRRLIFALPPEGLSDLREAPAAQTRRLLDRGIRFALRGEPAAVFTALSRAEDLPLDFVLIDGPDVSAAPQDADATERMRLALVAAKGLDLPVLACGVTTREGAHWLVQQGCRFGAGTCFSEAVAADEVAAWLAPRETVAA